MAPVTNVLPQRANIAESVSMAYIDLLNLFHESHNAPVPYPTMQDFVTDMLLLQNGALWDTSPMPRGICEMGILRIHGFSAVCRLISQESILPTITL